MDSLVIKQKRKLILEILKEINLLIDMKQDLKESIERNEFRTYQEETVLRISELNERIEILSLHGKSVLKLESE